MMKLLKTQSGVDLKALGKTSADIADQNRYRYYADLFADVIRQQVAIKSIYCGTSYELRLEELKEHGEQIVNTVIAHISHASETTIQATGQPRGWCGFFSSCCPSRQHRLSDIELDEMKGDSLIRSSETREGQKRPGQRRFTFYDKFIVYPAPMFFYVTAFNNRKENFYANDTISGGI